MNGGNGLIEMSNTSHTLSKEKAFALMRARGFIKTSGGGLVSEWRLDERQEEITHRRRVPYQYPKRIKSVWVERILLSLVHDRYYINSYYLKYQGPVPKGRSYLGLKEIVFVECLKRADNDLFASRFERLMACDNLSKLCKQKISEQASLKARNEFIAEHGMTPEESDEIISIMNQRYDKDTHKAEIFFIKHGRYPFAYLNKYFAGGRLYPDKEKALEGTGLKL